MKNVKKMWISTSGYLMTREHYVDGWSGSKFCRAHLNSNETQEIQFMLRRTYGLKAVFTVSDGRIYHKRRNGQWQYVESLYCNLIWSKVDYGAEPYTIGDAAKKQGAAKHEDEYDAGGD